MPVIGIPRNVLNRQMGKDIDSEQLMEYLIQMGCDVEGITDLRRFRCQNCQYITEITQTEDPPNTCDQCNRNFQEHPEDLTEIDPIEVIRMELLAVRPDIFDAGGLSRALKGYLNLEKGLPSLEVESSAVTLTVDVSMSRPESYRPYIVCAIVRNIKLDEEIIKMVMKLQENLHWALGRNRKLASIGVYDYDTVQPPFFYKAVAPEERTFVPLGYSLNDPNSKVTPKAILEKHPKGMAFAHLLQDFKAYPLLVDSQDNVLSMPPIINSEDTRVTWDTKNFIIDVTGPGLRLIERALNILVANLKEMQPSIQVQTVTVKYPDGQTRITPDFTPQMMKLSCQETNRIIGLSLTSQEVVDNLLKMRHNASLLQDNDTVDVQIAAYRNDIMHQRDLIEDVAIAYGYHNLVPAFHSEQTTGEEREIESFSNKLRQVFYGLGFQEIITLMLTSTKKSFEDLRLPVPEDIVTLQNPINIEQSILRRNLIPGLMETLAINVKNELPQRLFEIGDISQLYPEAETGAREVRMMAGGIIGPKTGFADLQSILVAILKECGFVCHLEALQDDQFITGRAASVMILKGEQQYKIGHIGEMHPVILDRFHLIHPVTCFEVQVSPMME